MLTRLLQAGAFLTALVSIATLFNALHPGLELFSHFRLQYFLGSLVLVLIFVVLREHRWAGGMLLLTAVNFLPLASWYLPTDSVANAAGQTVTLMQANVLGHGNQSDRVLAQIAAEQPDIVFLQEINEQWIAELQEIEENYPYRVAVPRDDNFGIAVYARKPLLNAEIIDSPPDGLPTLKFRQETGGRSVTYVTTHPAPPLGRSMTTSRNRQLQGIADLLAAIDGPKVLVGDLNITMWAHHYRQLENQTGLRNTRLSHGVLPTWPQHLSFTGIPIDHCLVSDEIVVLDTQVGKNNGSDHLPLFIKLAL